MALSDKKVLVVVPPEDFEDKELDLTRRVLESRGLKVSVASLHEGEVRGTRGMTVKANVAIDDVKTYDYDAVVFVGGDGLQRFSEDEKVLKLAKDAEHKVLGAISNASVILANSEAFKDKRKKATGDRSMARYLEAKGMVYTGQPVEVDDKLVTARGSEAAEPFANALLQTLDT